MNRTRVIVYMAVMLTAILIFTLVGSPYVSMDFAEAQSYGSSDDDDDGGSGSGDVGGSTGSDTSGSSDDDDDGDNGGGEVVGSGGSIGSTAGAQSAGSSAGTGEVVDVSSIIISDAPVVFIDGRVNDDITAPTAAFCDSGALTFYSAIGRGNAILTRAELIAGAAQAIASGASVTLLESSAVRLDVLPDQTLIMYASQPGEETYLYEFPLDQCGAVNINVNAIVLEDSEDDAPAPAARTVESGETYTVQPGDSLSRIARENGVTVDELIAANGIDNPDSITAGSTLIIP